jgi:hypothetical protein
MTSPPRQQIALSHESPVRPKSVHSSHHYQNDSLESARLAVLDDLGSFIPEIPFQTFMEYLAPPQPDFDIDSTIEWLNSASDPTLTLSNQWTAFAVVPKDQGSEDTAFRPIRDIFSNVMKAIVANTRGVKLTEGDCSVDYVQNPNHAPTLTERHNASRPDGYLVLRIRKGGKEVRWADVVLSCEYKRKDGDDDVDHVRFHAH